MNKADLKKELKSYIKNFIVLLLVSIPLSMQLSLSQRLLKISDDRLNWFIDLGIYNFFALLIVSSIIYLTTSSRTVISIKYSYSKEGYNKVKLNSRDNKRTYIEICLSGKKEKIPSEVCITFPEWLDFQLNTKNYIQQIDRENKCVINLTELYKNDSGYIQRKNTIPIDLIANEAVNNSITVTPLVSKKIYNPLISLKIEGLTIELEE